VLAILMYNAYIPVAALRPHLRHVTGAASRLREEVRCGHSRTERLRLTVSCPHPAAARSLRFLHKLV